MKLKSILILSCLIITFNNYSQETITKKENILIIAYLTNDCFSSVEEIFPKSLLFQKEDFKFSQILAENVIAPNKDVACIIETPIRYETKFGQTNLISLTDYEVKFFYNEDGYLNKVLQKEGNPYDSKVLVRTFEINIGKYGELLTKKNSYETNINGISKIIEYSDDGDVLYRHEIYYNSKGQIVKYDTFEHNEKQKKYTKSFDYDINGNLIKSSLVENYENEIIKTIPRRNVIYSHTNNEITSKSMSNNFAEGVNSFGDFSKIGGVTLNNFINNKKQKISNKSAQEIKKEITQKWENSAIDYVYIFKTKSKLNNWEEKKIFNKLYNQTTEKELIYSVKRKYINREDLKNKNDIIKTREKLNILIDDTYTLDYIQNSEYSENFNELKVDLNEFYSSFDIDPSSILPDYLIFSNDIVKFHKKSLLILNKKYHAKLEIETLNIEQLAEMSNEISKDYQSIITNTLEKIQNRKIIVDSKLKDKSIDKLYKNPRIAGSPTYNSTGGPYEGFKKENLYLAYKKLYKSIISEIEIEKYIELNQIQDKMFYLETLNTKNLEKTLRNENNEIEITKAILNFQVQ